MALALFYNACTHGFEAIGPACFKFKLIYMFVDFFLSQKFLIFFDQKKIWLFFTWIQSVFVPLVGVAMGWERNRIGLINCFWFPSFGAQTCSSTVKRKRENEPWFPQFMAFQVFNKLHIELFIYRDKLVNWYKESK